MQSLMAMGTSGYLTHLARSLNEHGQYHRDGNIMLNNSPWIAISCVPLSYLTKSIVIPMIYFIGSLSFLLYRELIKKDCLFCRPNIRDLEQVSMTGEPSGITINEMNLRRQQIMLKMFEKNQVNTIDELSKALDEEIKRVNLL